MGTSYLLVGIAVNLLLWYWAINVAIKGTGLALAVALHGVV
jgi:hypothetical protein